MKKWYLLVMLMQTIGLHAMEMESTSVVKKSLVTEMIELAVVESMNDEIESFIFSDRQIKNLANWVSEEHKKIDPKILMAIQSYPALYTITFLNLSNNQLKDLPIALKALTNIEYFNVSQNKLSVIPKVAENWRNLETLIVSDNLIESIAKIGDEPLSNFKKLTLLNISKNKIKELPCEELYELYQEQQDKRSCFWVCTDEDFELNEDLSKVRDQIFHKPDSIKIKEEFD